VLAPARRTGQYAPVLDWTVLRLWWIGVVLAVVASCGDETRGPRYSAIDLRRGVEVEVDDPDGLIDSATVFLPNDLPSFMSLQSQLDKEGVAVLQPGEGGYDVVVVYIAGPYCGLLPEVWVGGVGTQIRTLVRSRTSGTCDDMQYVEAVGLQIVAGHGADPVEATHSGRPQVEI
jgi:hypothetical protein